MPAELGQTLVNAVLLIGVTLIAGTIGLKRFEAMEHAIEGLRTELKRDIALVDSHVGEVRADLAQTRSDVALAVGARRAEGSS